MIDFENGDFRVVVLVLSFNFNLFVWGIFVVDWNVLCDNIYWLLVVKVV